MLLEYRLKRCWGKSDAFFAKFQMGGVKID